MRVCAWYVVADDEGQTLQSTSVYSEPYTMLFTVRALCLQYLIIFTTVVKYTCRSSCMYVWKIPQFNMLAHSLQELAFTFALL